LLTSNARLDNEPILVGFRKGQSVQKANEAALKGYPSSGTLPLVELGAEPQSLRPERINYLQKRELMKILIAGADSSNAVLAHENCRMRVMQEITDEMRQLQNLSGDVGMPVRGNQNGEARRSKQGRYALPRR
jgi:hypothetical protein